MRLGQLARKLNIKPADIVTFLDGHDIAVEDNPNTKIENEALDLTLKAFGEAEADQVEETVEQPAEEDIKVEETPLAIEEEQSEEEIENAALEAVAEEVLEEVSEDDDSSSAKGIEAGLEDEITEADIEERIEDGVIKAPKKELEGFTVVGKIELPTVKRSVTFISTNSGASTDITEEIAEKRKADRAARKQREYEARQSRKKQSRPKKQRRVLTDAEKKAHQDKIDAKKAAKKAATKKANKKNHYIENVQKKQSAQLQQKKKKEIEKSLKKQKPKDTRPEPTTAWGKFLRWLNT